MIWTDSPCRITCWNYGHETELAMQDSSIECIVAQHPWFEIDCIYVDIVLPASTYMEVDDILTNIRQGTMQPNIMIAEKAIEPLGESKSDAECMLEVAKQFEGMFEQITEGKTTEDLQKAIWGYMGGENLVFWEQLQEKQYWMFNTAPDWKDDSPGFRDFYNNPEKHKLSTPTGKLEFYSEALAKAYPDDKERGIVLAGAYVTERLRAGVAYVDHGARHDPIKTGEIERGGAINTITPGAVTSENCVGQIGGGYLVEVQKVSGEEMDRWRRDFPEAFARNYDPAAGLRVDAWIVDRGKKA